MVNLHLTPEMPDVCKIICVIVYNLYYCCYVKTSSSAVQKRHSKVYGKPIRPLLVFYISLWYPILLVKILNYDFPKIVYNGLKGSKGIKKGQLRGPHSGQSLQLYVVQDRIVVQIFETQTTIIP